MLKSTRLKAENNRTSVSVPDPSRPIGYRPTPFNALYRQIVLQNGVSIFCWALRLLNSGGSQWMQRQSYYTPWRCWHDILFILFCVSHYCISSFGLNSVSLSVTHSSWRTQVIISTLRRRKEKKKRDGWARFYPSTCSLWVHRANHCNTDTRWCCGKTETW